MGAGLGLGQFWQLVEPTRAVANGRRCEELNCFFAGRFCYVALALRDESRSWRKERGGNDQRGRRNRWRTGRGGGGSAGFTTLYIHIYIYIYSIGFCRCNHLASVRDVIGRLGRPHARTSWRRIPCGNGRQSGRPVCARLS